MDPDPDPTPDPTPFFSNFRDAKKFIFFSYNLPFSLQSSVLKIKFFATILCQNLFCRHYFSPLNTFMRKGTDPDPHL
jgi:hypothetical protein